MLGERLRVAFPLLLSVAGFILAMLALFAGSSPGMLENAHIVQLNVTNFGHDALGRLMNQTLNDVAGNDSPTTTTGAAPTKTDESWWDRATATIGSIIDDGKDKVEEEARELVGDLNEIANNATEKVLDKLDVAQWYSLHVMTFCMGDRDQNITLNCTERRAGVQIVLPDWAGEDLDKNVTDALKQSLSDKVAQVDNSVIKNFLQSLVSRIPNIPVPEDLLKVPETAEDAVKALNAALLGIFVLFTIGAALSGLAILLCLAAFLLASRVWAFVNAIAAGLAALVLMIAAIITTVLGKKAEEEINQYSDDVGISASMGSAFLGLSWAAFGVMFIAFVFWVVPSCHGRRKDAYVHRHDREKVAAKHSMESSHSRRAIFTRRR